MMGWKLKWLDAKPGGIQLGKIHVQEQSCGFRRSLSKMGPVTDAYAYERRKQHVHYRASALA
jgi:hypothetical protein